MGLRRPSLLLTACLILAVAALPAAAQETRGAIEGTVKDVTGGALPGATVQARQVATALAQTSGTDGTGAFRFPALAPGTYVVTATLGGFAAATIEPVVVNVGQLLRVPIVLAVAGLDVRETVTAGPPIVEVKQHAAQATVTAELIALLPKGRDWQSAIQGIAGTNFESGIDGSRATGIMIDGAAQSENRFLIDGQDTTDLRTGLSGKGLVVDFIEQIQVKQSGYNAEFRATTGGVVSAITRSGTNAFHGGIAADYQGKALNMLLGAIRPTLQLDARVATDPQPAQYITTPRTSEYERHTFEPIFDLGGPIVRNRAWFFAGHNAELFNQHRTVRWANPTVQGVTYPSVQTFDLKTRDRRLLYNGTIQITRNLRARLTGNNQRTRGGLPLPTVDAARFVVDAGGDTIGLSLENPATFNPRSSIYIKGANDSYSATVDWMLGAKTYANLTGGLLDARSGHAGDDYNHGIRRTFFNSNSVFPEIPAALTGDAGFSDGASNSFTVRDNYARYNISGDVTRYLDWRGGHAIKAGLQYERIANDTNAGQQAPNVTLYWNQTLITLDSRAVSGPYGFYAVVQQYTIGDIHSNNYGLFVQDQWTVSQKLTLNYGVRFDKTTIPSYRPENPGVTFGWGDKIAPRAGVAYDVNGDGKWKAFGSWGVFYDIEKLEMPRGAWGAEHWVTYYWTLDDYTWPLINCDGTPAGGCPGRFIEQNDLRHVSNDAGNNLVDPNLKPYKTQEFVLGLDHELDRLMSVGIRYVHKWVNSAIEDVGLQVVGLGEVFYIANPGHGLGAYPLGPEFPRSPRPVRDYDALEFDFSRRYANRWSLSGNLTLSRLYGNYSGLSNSTSESNRNSPNVTRLWDGLFMGFTEKGCPASTDCGGLENYGRISTDRPFQFKLLGTYRLPWGTSVGVSFLAQSGNLQTSTVTYKAVPVMIYGPGDLGRTDTYTNTDLNVSQTFTLPKNLRMTVQLNLSNLFDQGFVTAVFTEPWRDPLVLEGDACTYCGGPFFAGFNTRAVMAARNAANPGTGRPDSRYNLPSGFRGPRTARFYVKLQF